MNAVWLVVLLLAFIGLLPEAERFSDEDCID
jgi:hypothetical protein